MTRFDTRSSEDNDIVCMNIELLLRLECPRLIPESEIIIGGMITEISAIIGRVFLS